MKHEQHLIDIITYTTTFLAGLVLIGFICWIFNFVLKVFKVERSDRGFMLASIGVALVILMLCVLITTFQEATF